MKISCFSCLCILDFDNKINQVFSIIMSITISLPESHDLKPKIMVFGVGGAGGNAVNNMIQGNVEGVVFVTANTDAQALQHSLASSKVQLGNHATQGLGAGAQPDIGRLSAEESAEDIAALLENVHMLFITAGMGGGTGTGAAPVIARIAKERGILVVGVVTKPFHFEGARRMKVAESGIQEMNKYVDTLIVIPNQNLFRLATENTTFTDAFRLADDVLHSGVRSVTDLITMPGLVNLDFADIKTVMGEKGKAMMGTGEAEGDNRAILAAEAAISNPLLDHTSMKGARAVLINVTGGEDTTLFQVDAAANRIREEVDPNANIIFGSAFNSNLKGKIRVSIVATGIEDQHKVALQKLVDTPAVHAVQAELMENSFIPNKAIDPHLFAGDEVEISVTETAEEVFNDSLPITQDNEILDTPANDMVNNAVQDKLQEEMFDIPAFLRKKMKF